MGHSHSRSKSAANSYQRNENSDTQSGGNEYLHAAAARELPRVHSSGSVASVDCINGTSVCLSGGSDGVSIFTSIYEIS